MDLSKRFPFRFNLRGRLSVRAQRWARARQGYDTPPLTLLQRRIYILPTKAGLSAGALLFAMLLAGMNYGNSVALFLCFMLAGVALVSMHECHRALAGLRLARAQADNTFATQRGCLQLTFENPDIRLRDSLAVTCEPCAEVGFRLEPGQLKTVTLHFQAGRRGRQRIDRVRLATTTPIGLFRGWVWIHLPTEAVIYPQPLGEQPLPPRKGRPQTSQRSRQNQGEEEWAWLRNFQSSDPPRSVAWKAFARGAPLMVAHYDSPAGSLRTLNLASTPGFSVEQKLSQISKWILECERLGEDYSLELPGQSLPAGHGSAHRRACLESLALYSP